MKGITRRRCQYKLQDLNKKAYDPEERHAYAKAFARNITRIHKNKHFTGNSLFTAEQVKKFGEPEILEMEKALEPADPIQHKLILETRRPIYEPTGKTNKIKQSIRNKLEAAERDLLQQKDRGGRDATSGVSPPHPHHR